MLKAFHEQRTRIACSKTANRIRTEPGLVYLQLFLDRSPHV